ncbi:protein GrpE-like [Vigna umbellata]|uniref:protein GrpE-like n=1 Tax=Vigna umbellata TaxID=87088 RepID=UPI001F5FABDC|nr:protein GrpE-like [Vigna umbellata]
MATFLSNQSLFAPCPCSTPFSSKLVQTLKPKIVYFSSRGFPRPLNSSPNRRTPLKYSQDPPPTRNDETGETRKDFRGIDDDEDKKPLPSLMVLLEAYKEAFFNGDENGVALIEEGIYSAVNRKNKLIQKVSSLSADKATSKDRYVRLQADFDNFRKRSDKERLSIQSDAQQELIEQLLLMVDSFEKTKQQTKAATEKEKKIDVSYQGIYKQFVEILRSHHVSVIATVGKPFNPLHHEAIAREESAEFKKGIIIKESRRGFLLRDRILRPAQVKVSLGPGTKKSPVAHDNSMERPSTAAGIDER